MCFIILVTKGFFDLLIQKYYRHSIRTRVKTPCWAHHTSRFYILTIPLEQGLRHLASQPTRAPTFGFYRYSIRTRIKTLQAGISYSIGIRFYRYSIRTRIKTSWLCVASVYQHSIAIPLEQGLRRHSSVSANGRREDSIAIPLEQGLRIANSEGTATGICFL